jgi:nucleotidyltransferase substrate binding protein (TIGR01987 family)
MTDLDIRWKQRFSNYKKALLQMELFVAKGKLSILEKQGFIKSFEYTYELAWNTMKDYYQYQGTTESIQGSRDIFRLAFKMGLIDDGSKWMDMIQSKIQTVHTYDEKIANKIVDLILNHYYPLFVNLRQKMDSLCTD